MRGDHSEGIRNVNEALLSAKLYASDSQKEIIDKFVQSLVTEDLESYRESLKRWFQDRSRPINFVFGFVEPYRDPAGMKAEFEGILGVLDEAANLQADQLISQAEHVPRGLPWVPESSHQSFEKKSFDAPSLMCVNTVASALECGSVGQPSAEDDLYNLYQQMACDGLFGLAGFEIRSQKGGSAHSQAHFAMLQWLLRHGDDVSQVRLDGKPKEPSLKVDVDRPKLSTSGNRAIREMLMKLHIYRCTADVQACRPWWKELSTVSGESLKWHDAICSTPTPKKVFVHGNLMLVDGYIILKE